jgi:3-dehydroquinate synthase
MKIERLDLGERSYNIYIGKGLLDKLGEMLKQVCSSDKAFIISDQNVYDLYGDKADESLKLVDYDVYEYIIPPGDRSKSLETAGLIYDALFEAEIERSNPFVAFGGGVVGDLTGFVAGTWLRGVPFVQVPTTIEAAIDASVGGKTAVNHPKGKNLIGVFYQPKMVLIDTQLLNSLTGRDISAGLAESIKHAVIKDTGFFEYHEKFVKQLLELDSEIVETLLARNCRIKADVVSGDERESGERAILNFGHTVGHAIEISGGLGRWRHGEAVALGMVAAGFIAAQRGTFSKMEFHRMEKLIDEYKLPIRCADLDFGLLMELMKRDKKVQGGKIRFVLPTRIGATEIVSDVTDSQIKSAIDYLKSYTARG